MKREAPTATGTMTIIDNSPETASSSLAIYLAELERVARIGTSIQASDALELISLLRQYMAHSETIERSVEAMSKSLGGHE